MIWQEIQSQIPDRIKINATRDPGRTAPQYEIWKCAIKIPELGKHFVVQEKILECCDQSKSNTFHSLFICFRQEYSNVSSTINDSISNNVYLIMRKKWYKLTLSRYISLCTFEFTIISIWFTSKYVEWMIKIYMMCHKKIVNNFIASIIDQ